MSDAVELIDKQKIDEARRRHRTIDLMRQDGIKVNPRGFCLRPFHAERPHSRRRQGLRNCLQMTPEGLLAKRLPDEANDG